MTSKTLTPLTTDSLREFHEFFTERHAGFDTIREFFFSLGVLVDERLSGAMTPHVMDLMEMIGFDDHDEAAVREFLDRYVAFANGSIHFIHDLESLDSAEHRRERADDLLATFEVLYAGDRDRLGLGIGNGVLDLIGAIGVVAGVRDIVDLDEFMHVVGDRFGEDLAHQVMELALEAGEAREEPSDGTIADRLFHAVIPLVMRMDEHRLQTRARRESLRHTMAEVGRNGLCPCGSGRKFKKCCMAALQ